MNFKALESATWTVKWTVVGNLWGMMDIDEMTFESLHDTTRKKLHPEILRMKKLENYDRYWIE
jgi:hypothetical protein